MSPRYLHYCCQIHLVVHSYFKLSLCTDRKRVNIFDVVLSVRASKAAAVCGTVTPDNGEAVLQVLEVGGL